MVSITNFKVVPFWLRYIYRCMLYVHMLFLHNIQSSVGMPTCTNCITTNVIEVKSNTDYPKELLKQKATHDRR